MSKRTQIHLPNRQLMDLNRRQTRLSFVLLVFPGSLIWFLLPLFLGAATETFSLSERQIGLLASSDLIGYATTAVSAFFWVRGVNWRHTILFALLLLVVANLATVLLNGFLALVTIRLVCGAASGIVASVCVAYFHDASHSIRIVGTAMATQAIMGGGLMYVAPDITSSFGFAGICYLLATVSVVFLPALIYVPARGKERPKFIQGHSLIGVSSILTIVAIIIFYIATFALWAYVERMGVASGFEPKFIGTVLGTCTALGFTGALTAGFIEDRFGMMWPVLLYVLGHITAALLLWFDAVPLAFIIAVALIQFFSYNFSGPILFGILSATDTSGRCSVLYSFAVSTGAALGPLLGGVIVSYDKTFNALYFFSAFAALFTLPLIFQVNYLLKSRNTMIGNPEDCQS